jgi:hypothetical protein
VVQDRLAPRGVGSIAYDRAGLGHSDPGPAPCDVLAVAGDLEALLAAAGEAGPLIHVAHSMAGLHAHLFVARNPGLVLVDAVTPGLAEAERTKRLAARYVRLARAAAWRAGQGLLRPLRPLGDTIGLGAEAAAYERWAFAHGPHNRAAADEVTMWEAAARQVRAAGPLDPHWPVAVVTAGPGGQRPVMTGPAWASSRGCVAHVAAANHASLFGRRHADAVVRAIEQVRAASRT